MATETDTRLVHQESLSYQIGFEHGLVGKKYFCPSSGNPYAENDYAWGWQAGRVRRERGEA